MREVTLEELLEAGCHFGHQVTRQNPKARDFVFEARDNIHIIDLAKTKEGLEEAGRYIKELASKEDSSIIVVGTKRQAQAITQAEVKRAREAGTSGIYYITNRWIGGVLTNISEVLKNTKKLKDITARLHSDEEKAKYTKKEVGGWEKERVKLEGFYGGILEMQKVPDALFIIDTHMEDLAVREGIRMHVPIVGITDTNSDPTIIDYPIPANDDAVGSIELITKYIIDAWVEGKTKKATEETKVEKETHSTSSGQAKGTKEPKGEKETKSKSVEGKVEKKESEEKPKKKASTKKKKEEKS